VLVVVADVQGMVDTSVMELHIDGAIA